MDYNQESKTLFNPFFCSNLTYFVFDENFPGTGNWGEIQLRKNKPIRRLFKMEILKFCASQGKHEIVFAFENNCEIALKNNVFTIIGFAPPRRDDPQWVMRHLNDILNIS